MAADGLIDRGSQVNNVAIHGVVLQGMDAASGTQLAGIPAKPVSDSSPEIISSGTTKHIQRINDTNALLPRLSLK